VPETHCKAKPNAQRFLVAAATACKRPCLSAATKQQSTNKHARLRPGRLAGASNNKDTGFFVRSFVDTLQRHHDQIRERTAVQQLVALLARAFEPPQVHAAFARDYDCW
jgi:hypothetical protein